MANELDPQDTAMIMSLTFFVSSLTRSQRESLAVVLRHVVNTIKRQLPSAKHLAVSNSWKVPVPISKESIRSVIWEEKHCIRENLPHPSIHTDVSEHAYLPPSECVADLLAHGLLEESGAKKRDYESLSEARVARLLVEENQRNGIRTIFLSLWCDDFEPSNTKNNQGKVWIMTLTVESAESGCVTINHVYPIAIGPKTSNHFDLMEMIWTNLNSLKPVGGMTMYNGSTGRTEQVCCYVVACTMDQPESRAVNGLLLGGSRSLARHGYCIDISQFRDTIRPCKECWDTLLSVKGNDHWLGTACQSCDNWMLNPAGMEYSAPENFPTSELNSNSRLNCLKLEYPLLKAIVKRAHDKIVSSEWTQTNAQSYLKARGIRKESEDDIILRATNCLAYKKTLENHTKDPTAETADLLRTFDYECQAKPDLYKMWREPPYGTLDFCSNSRIRRGCTSCSSGF